MKRTFIAFLLTFSAFGLQSIPSNAIAGMMGYANPYAHPGHFGKPIKKKKNKTSKKFKQGKPPPRYKVRQGLSKGFRR